MQTLFSTPAAATVFLVVLFLFLLSVCGVNLSRQYSRAETFWAVTVSLTIILGVVYGLAWSIYWIWKP